MENFFKRVSLAFSLVIMVALTGCAISPPVAKAKNDSVRVACAIVTAVVEGKVVAACTVDGQKINPETGENAGGWVRTVQLFESLPTLGEIAKGLVPSGVVGLIQRDAAKDVAKIQAKTCKDGGCGGGTPVQVFTTSQANSLTQVGVEANVSSGAIPTGGCTTCGGLPRH